jgi:hypothetical protein
MTDWSKPQEVTDLDMAFCVRAGALMPPRGDLPKCYYAFPGGRDSVRFASMWFFKGFQKADFTPREGVDTRLALRHIKACIGSFELKHEHKMAGVAFLLDQFFEKVVTDDKTYEFSKEVPDVV